MSARATHVTNITRAGIKYHAHRNRGGITVSGVALIALCLRATARATNQCGSVMSAAAAQMDHWWLSIQLSIGMPAKRFRSSVAEVMLINADREKATAALNTALVAELPFDSSQST